MTTLYKLTDQDGYTRRGEYNQTKWGPGVTHSGTGKGELCGPGYIHAYEHPLLAILLNPIHADISDPLLWECEGEIVKNDIGNNRSNIFKIGSLKCGCISLTTVKEIPLPIISSEQKIKFAILCSLKVYKEASFVKWANDWLSGKDRRSAAARAAAARAAYAAYAADAAADAARAAYAAYAADAAADAARAARAAATVNLIELAKKAMEEQ